MEATTGTQPLSPLAPQPLPLICGVMEHIEEAGIHSGDSACTVPPYSLSPQVVQRLKDQSRALAQELDVCGLMNVQWAVRDGEIYVIEVNPRASRTVPFVGKASGVQWARLAAKAMMGQSLDDLEGAVETTPNHTSVKESVFPFEKFPGVDVILGPEMRSTGECMGADYDFPLAFAKSQMAAGVSLPTQGKVFLSVRESDKAAAVGIGRQLLEMGFDVLTTSGTHQYLADHHIETQRLNKIKEGRPNAVDLMKNQDLALLINTPTQKGGGTDEATLRAMAVRHRLPMITTMTGARVAVRAIAALGRGDWTVNALQDYFPAIGR